MYDPRWNDLREHDDGRARVYDDRDRPDHDLRDGLMHDLDLQRGEGAPAGGRSRPCLRADGDDSRTLAAVGTFRVVPEQPDRSEDEIRAWAREHDLPYFDGQMHFPDYRIEYTVDGREHHDDVELFTAHYRGAHAASHAHTGLRIYTVASRAGSDRARSHPRIMEEFL